MGLDELRSELALDEGACERLRGDGATREGLWRLVERCGATRGVVARGAVLRVGASRFTDERLGGADRTADLDLVEGADGAAARVRVGRGTEETVEGRRLVEGPMARVVWRFLLVWTSVFRGGVEDEVEALERVGVWICPLRTVRLGFDPLKSRWVIVRVAEEIRPDPRERCVVRLDPPTSRSVIVRVAEETRPVPPAPRVRRAVEVARAESPPREDRSIAGEEPERLATRRDVSRELRAAR